MYKSANKGRDSENNYSSTELSLNVTKLTTTKFPSLTTTKFPSLTTTNLPSSGKKFENKTLLVYKNVSFTNLSFYS